MRRVVVVILVALAACTQRPATDAGVTFTCELAEGATAPDSLSKLGCFSDFTALASVPIDSNIPGARSAKVVLDQAASNALHFQNSTKYQVHYEFVSAHLSGGALPVVPSLSSFNTTEYFSPERRFILGAVSYYEGPGVFALELSPYDTASAAMMQALYEAVQAHAYFGASLVFHPTSDAVALEAKQLPASVKVMTTDQLYAGIDYQPLTLATGVGRLRFTTAAALELTPPSNQDLLVLDEAPNDISVVQGLITQTFQTPLSHINVLSANRKTPNMGLKHAQTNELLRSLEGKLVELTVGALAWSVREVTQAEAEAFWLAHRPTPVTLPPFDLTQTGLVDVESCTPDPTDGGTLREAIKDSVRAYGGKAAQYSILKRLTEVPVRPAFVVPIAHYDAFMRSNGLFDLVDGYLADPVFRTDAAVRVQKLAELHAAIMSAPVDPALQQLLRDKAMEPAYLGSKLRFRTSTNSEDLDGFPCAGCYVSHTGDPTDWPGVLDAVRATWASTWSFRTFEEREYYGIDHHTVGMALLVHRNFPDEEANGVAVTSNPYDASGLDPAFYVNVQWGGAAEVVAPPPGVKSDEFLYYFSQPNQPITFLTHSNLVAPNTTVLDGTQTYQLGRALDAIHKRFSAAYGPGAGNLGWYAMDVEFKFDDDGVPGQRPTLWVKQARPYPGRGQ
ncbi:MAG: PEP/pyruvate-binding domain-containing protein [Archangium sp.]|nr:PEP/pyruvate-binding domain-containing protein [Archangium sp.]